MKKLQKVMQKFDEMGIDYQVYEAACDLADLHKPGPSQTKRDLLAVLEVVDRTDNRLVLIPQGKEIVVAVNVTSIVEDDGTWMKWRDYRFPRAEQFIAYMTSD